MCMTKCRLINANRVVVSLCNGVFPGLLAEEIGSCRIGPKVKFEIELSGLSLRFGVDKMLDIISIPTVLEIDASQGC